MHGTPRLSSACNWYRGLRVTSDRYVEVEGAPDSIVSDSSHTKDGRRLPVADFHAGIPECRLADVCGESIIFQSHCRGESSLVAADAADVMNPGYILAHIIRANRIDHKRRQEERFPHTEFIAFHFFAATGSKITPPPALPTLPDRSPKTRRPLQSDPKWFGRSRSPYALAVEPCGIPVRPVTGSRRSPDRPGWYARA